MSTRTPSRFNTPGATQSLDARRQARVVASFAEYLAEYVHGSPDRALEAMASLAEWCDGDPSLLARARADVLHDIRDQHLAIAENNQDAVSLLISPAALSSGVRGGRDTPCAEHRAGPAQTSLRRQRTPGTPRAVWSLNARVPRVRNPTGSGSRRRSVFF